MRTLRQSGDTDGFGVLAGWETEPLEPGEERALLQTLAECKEKLAAALDEIECLPAPSGAGDSRWLASLAAAQDPGQGPAQAALGAVARRYQEARSRLALSNVRLVAHIAKRFRGRGIAYSDLLQEGFCGLLEAIDRFDLSHSTKLATYATWWVRQAVQRAVAEGAYPVRLTPRHLRQLAQNQEGCDHGPASTAAAPPNGPRPVTGETIQRIQTATRPTISLDAGLGPGTSFGLIQLLSDPEGDRTDAFDTGEALDLLLEELRPREQQVLALRFGLGGAARHSLSEVGRTLSISKERVRQIQDRALEKLRALAVMHHLEENLELGN